MSDSGARATPPDPPETTRPHRLSLILVRHGCSTWNTEQRIQGQLDPPLTEIGEKQARLLGERLADMQFDGFYTSDLRRAADTAGAVAERLGRAPQSVPELREIALGEWEGLTRAEITERYPKQWQAWLKQPDWDIVPGGEGTRHFEERVGRGLDQLMERHPTGRVLVVTHGGVIQVALLRVVGRSSNGLFPFTIENTSLTVIEGRPPRMVVSRVNDTCHLN